MSDVTLPLFPLRTVLFPGMLLPLHIFEPRYRVLVQRCVETGGAFGVALIRSGEEVGGAAEPFETGTTARIAGVVELPHGGYEIVARGERRFAIEAILTDVEPYLVARVRFLPEDDGEAEPLARSAADSYAEYLLGITAVGQGAEAGAGAAQGEASGSPSEVAYRIAAGLGVDRAEKQRLLELPTTRERLETELRILHREIVLLRELIVRQHARDNAPPLN